MTPLQAIIQLLLTLVFGLFVAFVIGAFLYSLLTKVNRGFNAVVSSLFSDVDDADLAKPVRMAIISGVVGGIAFAAMGPAFAPFIYDTQVATGIVSEPTPEVGVYQVGDPPEEDLERASLPVNDTYSRYILNISHSGARSIDSYSLNIRFNGCVDSASLGISNFDTAVMSSQSESVQVGEFAKRPANTTCYGAIQIDDFLPSHSAIVVFTVDHTPEPPSQDLYPNPERTGTVLITDSYSWEYSGRLYYNKANLQIHEMNSTSSVAE
ncbi:hypothetical protein [Haloarcula marina]|uniref:hypothetical protein n=1 Tax=Haloarcula marina TaxID=2961574 RepID=UPI0020B7AB02|nr:hypothetical protein [Halomicroarcula marina]